jgi:hypothetical protein
VDRSLTSNQIVTSEPRSGLASGCHVARKRTTFLVIGAVSENHGVGGSIPPLAPRNLSIIAGICEKLVAAIISPVNRIMQSVMHIACGLISFSQL